MVKTGIWKTLVPAALIALGSLMVVRAQYYDVADKTQKLRSVQGIVTDGQENPLSKAVVQLKNAKTLQVKSFYTDDKGAYRFHGLDPEQDYELKAEYGNASSPARKVTSFDSRREVVINFKLDVKQ